MITYSHRDLINKPSNLKRRKITASRDIKTAISIKKLDGQIYFSQKAPHKFKNVEKVNVLEQTERIYIKKDNIEYRNIKFNATKLEPESIQQTKGYDDYSTFDESDSEDDSQNNHQILMNLFVSKNTPRYLSADSYVYTDERDLPTDKLNQSDEDESDCHTEKLMQNNLDNHNRNTSHIYGAEAKNLNSRETNLSDYKSDSSDDEDAFDINSDSDDENVLDDYDNFDDGLKNYETCVANERISHENSNGDYFSENAISSVIKEKSSNFIKKTSPTFIEINEVDYFSEILVENYTSTYHNMSESNIKSLETLYDENLVSLKGFDINLCD